jgi:hypothetical protein
MSVKLKNKIYKITTEDMAIGLGRKITDEEWNLHLQETATEDEINGISLEEMLVNTKTHLKRREVALKASLSEK